MIIIIINLGDIPWFIGSYKFLTSFYPATVFSEHSVFFIEQHILVHVKIIRKISDRLI